MRNFIWCHCSIDAELVSLWFCIFKLFRVWCQQLGKTNTYLPLVSWKIWLHCKDTQQNRQYSPRCIKFEARQVINSHANEFPLNYIILCGLCGNATTYRSQSHCQILGPQPSHERATVVPTRWKILLKHAIQTPLHQPNLQFRVRGLIWVVWSSTDCCAEVLITVMNAANMMSAVQKLAPFVVELGSDHVHRR